MEKAADKRPFLFKESYMRYYSLISLNFSVDF